MKKRWVNNLVVLVLVIILWLIYTIFFKPVELMPFIFIMITGFLLAELIIQIKKNNNT